VTVLEAGAARVEIDAAAGGRIAAFRLDGLDLLVTGGSTALDWGCYPMAPWVGRIRHGEFRWEGGTYRVPVNFGAHAIHGTTFDVAWSEDGPGRLSVPLGSRWPWPGRARQEIVLTLRELSLRLEVRADSTPMPVVVGWHPWWSRRLARGAALTVELPGDAVMYRRDADGIPSADLVPAPPGPWDDCFTSRSGLPILRWPGAVELRVDTACDHWVVYDEPADALCVEPVTGPPDAFNLGLGVAVVSPGRPLVATARYRWRLEA
jgi:aldose 1-epimerase